MRISVPMAAALTDATDGACRTPGCAPMISWGDVAMMLASLAACTSLLAFLIEPPPPAFFKLNEGIHDGSVAFIYPRTALDRRARRRAWPSLPSDQHWWLVDHLI